jgi:hypothetical protein
VGLLRCIYIKLVLMSDKSRLIDDIRANAQKVARFLRSLGLKVETICIAASTAPSKPPRSSPARSPRARECCSVTALRRKTRSRR